MHALITGGLGYVGRATAIELSAAGWRVTLLGRARDGGLPAPVGTDVVLADVRDRTRLEDLVAGAEFDVVVHLAGMVNVAESIARPLDYYDVNVGGTINLLTSLAAGSARATRVIYGSTTLVYGSPASGAVDESVPTAPESPYAESKVATERLLRDHAAAGGGPVTVLRIFNVAGAVEGAVDADTTRLVPRMLDVAAGRRARAEIVGDGSAMRDFVHVADVAAAIRAAAERPAAPPWSLYNIGSGAGTSVASVVRAVETVTGRPLPIDVLPDRHGPSRVWAAIGAAERELRWTPRRSTIESIVGDAWRFQQPLSRAVS